MNVYICIGNTDNKLTQQKWAEFVHDVEFELRVTKQHGAWFSRPDAPWQNACWLLEFQSGPQIPARGQVQPGLYRMGRGRDRVPVRLRGARR